LVVALVGLGGLAQNLGDLGFEPLVGAVGFLGGVAREFGPVQRDGADPDHAGGGAQPERGDQEFGQSVLVANTEACDGHMVGRAVAGQDPESNVLVAAPLDLAGGTHPDRVGVQQYAEQRLRVIGRMAMPVGPVASEERRQVKLVDYVAHEPGEVAFGQPVAQVGREQEGLVAVATQEVVSHGVSYLYATLVPNVFVLKSAAEGPGISNAGLFKRRT